MRTLAGLAGLVTGLVVAASAAAQGPAIEIALRSGTPAEVQTRDQLRRLLDRLDVSAWVFTHRVLIDERSIPHSHPILTLSTRYTRDDDLLVATFLHEQIHGYLVARQAATDEAIAELKTLFPGGPVGGREGARSEYSTYLHLVVCYLEWRATEAVLGAEPARRTMDVFANDHYTWVYRTVLERGADVERILRARGLMHVLR